MKQQLMASHTLQRWSMMLLGCFSSPSRLLNWAETRLSLQSFAWFWLTAGQADEKQALEVGKGKGSIWSWSWYVAVTYFFNTPNVKVSITLSPSNLALHYQPSPLTDLVTPVPAVNDI